ncbi:MAG: hypothetical protein GXP62_15950 [Oligoflexia bacterium]|nr:hypothetical protein [Oligoflexia bacterium]
MTMRFMRRSKLFARLAHSAIAACALLAFGAPQPAQAKVAQTYNYPDLQWRSIQTEHFVVHYPVSKKTAAQGNEHYLTAEWSARKVARAAEDVWAPMCEEFNYFLKEQIHIVVLNQSDSLEGFTIPNLDWIELSANPGKGFARSRGRMEWFSDVLVHEFAHVVSLKANDPFAEAMMGVSLGTLYHDGIQDVDSGAQVFIGASQSVFWAEGGAEYWSDQAGWNWWTASRDQDLRMSVLEDRLLSYDEWQTASGKIGPGHWNDQERTYQQGYSFGQYLRQRFGDDTYARFALQYGKGWRAQWETVIQDVLGVDAHTLYDDWVAYITDRYTAQQQRIQARGLVEGHEITGFSWADWDYTDPEARDRWLTQTNDRGHRKGPGRAKLLREIAREGTGTYQWEPRVSADGKLWASLNYGTISVTRADESMFPALSGVPASDDTKLEDSARLSVGIPASFEQGFDFVPGQNKLVITASEHSFRNAFSAVTGLHGELDGYDWDQLYVFDLDALVKQKKQGNATVQTRARGARALHKAATPIPNTLRGSNPAVSPDGQRVAYFEYTDGVLNLVLIDRDGGNKRALTDWHDGTWMQGLDWSPDGSKLVVSMFRQYQQNLYIVDVASGDLRPLMWDSWEEADPHWAADGTIYFSADVDGVWNIFSVDPATMAYRQITNVIGGAISPQLTPENNLVYSYYSANGWKVYGLPRHDFFNRPADHYFQSETDQSVVSTALETQEDLSGLEAQTSKYRWTKSLMPPYLVPVVRLDNDSGTDFGLSAGFQLMIQDYAEKQGLYLYPSLGEDTLFLGQYFYQGWAPNFSLTGYHYDAKYNSGYLQDADGDLGTTGDQSVWEIRRAESVDILTLAVEYPWTRSLATTLFAEGHQYKFKTSSDGHFLPYSHNLSAGLSVDFDNAGGYTAANLTQGRTLALKLSRNWADVVYAPYDGLAVDDGQILDRYAFNQGELRYTEYIPLPGLGLGFLRKARDKGHTIQIDSRFGYIDRNVDTFDEFRAGGQHPLYWGYGSLQSSTLFQGYPQYSLSGETMAIVNLAYRFPLHDWHRKQVGPLFFHGVYGQLGATAGNLWSFRPPDDPSKFYRNRYGERIALDPGDVRREIPLVDSSYKNGNYLLYDAIAELRVNATMFHDTNWDSFIRLAYGFNTVRGTGDINGDYIYDTTDNGFGDQLSSETQPPKLRVYVGLGTGW